MSTDSKSIDWYNKNAAEYTAHVRNRDESIYHSLYEKPAMYSLLPVLRDKKVLSLGCGSGEDSKYLRQRGANKSVGVDISEGMIKIARESYPDCEFEVMNMEDLNFKTGSFDFVYSSLAIHYIADWSKVFKEVFRVLKPKSYFLFSCNHPIISAMALVTDSEEVEKMEMSFTVNKQKKEVAVIGSYMERRPTGYDTNVTTWHKPFGEIFKEISSAGFTLDTLLDPTPLEEMRTKAPLHYQRLSKIPDFAIFRLLKP